MKTASTVTRIIPASTVNSEHNSTAIIAQNNQPELISSELINLDISNTLQKSKHLANSKSFDLKLIFLRFLIINVPSTRPGARYNPSSSSQRGHRCDYGRSQSVTEGQGSVNALQINKLCHSESDNTILPPKTAYTATRSLSGHLKIQPEGLQQCIAAQRVPDPCRSVEKLHEFLCDCEKIRGPSQNLQVTQWMASIYGKEEHDPFNSRMEEKQSSTTKVSAKNSPNSRKQQFQCEKTATSSKQGQRQGTSHEILQPGL
ncbi:hypothetical protein O181_068309 [Austropuccinia psidii MF-1]|uniref:Uncharacterized protein n=1 Tax=Austropuccinia psidii MF-1 TaxID=1389203 RepID=A0A9Q3I7F3_9BASI|nr:hypothetical protein [Austropuccinia psidii MF-1]